jgi:hypothetical protein
VTEFDPSGQQGTLKKFYWLSTYCAQLYTPSCQSMRRVASKANKSSVSLWNMDCGLGWTK